MRKYRTGDVWSRVQRDVQSAVDRGIQNPLKNSSFFDTTSGYYVEQALLDVEDRRGMVAHSDGSRMKFYKESEPDVVMIDTDRDKYYRYVTELILFCNSREEFEQQYSAYLWDLIPY